MNTKHQLKSKLTWPNCPNSMKLKENGTGAVTTAKLHHWVCGDY